jgi:hypothetical protein
MLAFSIKYAVSEYKPFGLEKQFVSTVFYEFNERVSSRFAMVAASGETKNYSRVASALDFNWGE